IHHAARSTMIRPALLPVVLTLTGLFRAAPALSQTAVSLPGIPVDSIAARALAPTTRMLVAPGQPSVARDATVVGEPLGEAISGQSSNVASEVALARAQERAAFGLSGAVRAAVVLNGQPVA